MNLLWWRLGAGLVGVAIGWFLVSTVLGWREDAAKLPEVTAAYATYKANAEKEATRLREQNAADNELLSQASSELQALREDNARLMTAAQRAPLVTYREVPRDPTQPCPAVLDRSDAFRVCWNAAWTRQPADIAACEAFGVPDPAEQTVVPAPEHVRTARSR